MVRAWHSSFFRPIRGEKRPFGLCRGEFTVPGGFNEPDPELEALFYGAASDR